jgi:hypothetical protein
MFQTGLGIMPQHRSTAPWWPESATFAADFIANRYMKNAASVSAGSAFTFTRASTKLAPDSAGQWIEFSPDTPAFTDLGLLVEGEMSGPVADNSFASTVDGTVNGGATLPAGWLFTFTAGVSWEITDHGSDDGFGLPYIDLRLHGTNSSGNNGFPQARFWNGGSEAPFGAYGDILSLSAYIETTAAPVPPAQSAVLQMRIARDPSGFYFPAQSFGVAGRQRLAYTRQIGADTADELYADFISYQQKLDIGETVDITRRISGIQFETGTAPTSIMLSSGTPATRAADALTLHLPAGTFDLTVTLSDDSTQVINSVSGNFQVPTNLDKAITSISAMPT